MDTKLHLISKFPLRPAFCSERREITKSGEIMRRMLQRLLVMTSAVVCLFVFFDCGQAQQEERAPEGVIYKEKRVPSVIVTDWENSFSLGPTLLAPTIVRANEDFKIEFYTIGGSCVRKGDDHVTVLKNVATVKAYDLDSRQRMCNFVLLYLPHTITLRFTKPGKATIKIWGMREGNDRRIRRGPRIVLEHRLTVTEAEVKPKFDPDSRVDHRKNPSK
jgi:hypothetical protein